MKKYTKYLVWGVVIIVIVVAVILAKKIKVPKESDVSQTKKSVENTVSVTSTSSTENTTTTTKEVQKTIKPITKPVVSRPAPQSYTDAIEKYKNSGYYIQFFPCQATPGSLIVKQGSKIMLDNRDSKAHSIGIKSDKYLIASYNYAIATLNVIGTNYVTCDGGGSATITVVP